MKLHGWIDQCEWIITLACLIFKLLPFVVFYTWILPLQLGVRQVYVATICHSCYPLSSTPQPSVGNCMQCSCFFQIINFCHWLRWQMPHQCFQHVGLDRSWIFSFGQHFIIINPLPHMTILGSSNSAANKDMMSKMWINEDTIIWLSRKHCGKRTNCSLWAISSFSTMYSKAVCCWCVKMSIYGVKGYKHYYC